MTKQTVSDPLSPLWLCLCSSHDGVWWNWFLCCYLSSHFGLIYSVCFYLFDSQHSWGKWILISLAHSTEKQHPTAALCSVPAPLDEPQSAPETSQVVITIEISSNAARNQILKHQTLESIFSYFFLSFLTPLHQWSHQLSLLNQFFCLRVCFSALIMIVMV